MAKKGKMTEEEKAKLPEAFRNRWKKLSERSKDEAREAGRNGGIASVQSRKEKKEFRELLAMVDEMPMKAPSFAEGLRQLGIPEEVIANLDQKLAKVFALQRRCLSGDPQAIKLWLEQIGEHVDTIKHEGLPQQNGDLVLAPKKND